MSYQLTYWKQTNPAKPDDAEEVCKPRRIKRVTEIDERLRPIPKECTQITLDRTDRQSPISRVIWQRKLK